MAATPEDKTPTQGRIAIEPQNQSADVESQSDDDTEETIDDEMGSVLVSEEVMSFEEEPKSETKKREVPLLDYIINVCKFLDTMLSNNNTPDHCKAFIQEGGLPVLIQLLSLRALPIEFPNSQAASQIAQVLRTVFLLDHHNSKLQGDY